MLGRRLTGWIAPGGTIWHCLVLVVVATRIGGPTPASAEVLGSFPLCEASAVVIVDCGRASGSCLLVADNEIAESLFEVRLPEPGDSAVRRLPFAPKGKVSDIEALVALPSRRVLAVGSHSRNRRCEPKKKRRRLLLGVVGTDDVRVDSLVKSPELLQIALFGLSGPPGDLARSVQARIRLAEEEADALVRGLDAGGTGTTEDVADRCERVASFNVEGALYDGHHVWLGLRAPTMEDPANPARGPMAILLRLESLHAFRFDAVALLDLGGSGVRDLTVHERRVYVIGGPTDDTREGFDLYAFGLRSLVPDARIRPTRVTSSGLPASSEGIVFQGRSGYVVIDGAGGDDRCESPARYRKIWIR